jgi:type IV secretory pathway VirB2 component (pilin)
MKFINLLSVFTLIISQNILMASSAYAATVNIVLADKSTSCEAICTSTITSAQAAGSHEFSFTTTDTTGMITGMNVPKSYPFTAAAGPTEAQEESMCTTACFTYKDEVGFSLGDLDAVSNLSSNTLSKAVCNAFRIVTGGAGKTFASFAVIATGIGFFTGKVSWGLMIGVAAGIATMFGASSIVAAISGESVNTMCDINFKN